MKIDDSDDDYIELSKSEEFKLYVIIAVHFVLLCVLVWVVL